MVSPIMSPAPETPPQAEPRLLSLDVFRGGTMAAMILVNNPGSDAIYTPFEHAAWHGWTFTDLIFPFFLWMVGVSVTFSFAKRVSRGDSRQRLFLHILRRSALIYLVGLALVLVPDFHFSTVRIPGVLARIAVCYLTAGTIFLFTGLRGRIIALVLCLLSYWILMMYVPVPGIGAGHWEKGANLANWVDSIVLKGHMYSRTKSWDPEGLVSTLPSVATALFGIFAGMLLRTQRSREEKTVWLFFAGNVGIFAGLVLATWMPINKSLWTDSFSLFMAGMAAVVFASCYWLIDVQGWKRFTKPFQVFGMNAIASYILSGLLAKILGSIKVAPGLSLHRWIFQHVYAPWAAPELASLLFAFTEVLVIFGLASLLYRRQWFVRL